MLQEQKSILLKFCERLLSETNRPYWLLFETYRPEIDKLGEANQINTLDEVEAYLDKRIEQKSELFIDVACDHAGIRDGEGVDWVHLGFKEHSPNLNIEKEDEFTVIVYDYTPEKFHEAVSVLVNKCFPYNQHFASWNEGGKQYKATQRAVEQLGTDEPPISQFKGFIEHMITHCEKNKPIGDEHEGNYSLWTRSVMGEVLTIALENGFKKGDKSSIEGKPFLSFAWHTQDIAAEILSEEAKRRETEGNPLHPNDVNNIFLSQLRLIYNQLSILEEEY